MGASLSVEGGRLRAAGEMGSELVDGRQRKTISAPMCPGL